jgi:transposase-like protein
MAHLLYRLVEGRCPECKQYPALSKSGKERTEGRLTTEEWTCDHCGYRDWRDTAAGSAALGQDGLSPNGRARK